MATITQYAQFSAAAYDNGGSGDVGKLDPAWIRSDQFDTESGFSAAVFRNLDTGEVVIAYRGTNGVFDLVADAQLGVGQMSQQFTEAINVYNNVTTIYGVNNVTITGHSLGGALASYVAAISINQPVAIAFNAPGISNLVPANDYSNVTNYNSLYDPVSNLPYEQLGTSYTFPFVLGDHSPDWVLSFLKGLSGLPIFITKFLFDQHSIDNLAGVDFSLSQLFVQRIDPLTFDLDGDGLETAGISSTNPILFDHDGDGIKNATGWVGSDDGFLVLKTAQPATYISTRSDAQRYSEHHNLQSLTPISCKFPTAFTHKLQSSENTLV